MKRTSLFPLGTALVAFPLGLTAAPVLAPNGTFDNGSTDWFEENQNGAYTYTYPSTGGNPGGHGTINNTDGNGYGIWKSGGGTGTPSSFSSLGLTADKRYTFSLDMKILSGSEIGGLKIEFFNGTTYLGDTGDMFPDLIGDGSTWETYEFDVSMPLGSDGLIFVPLWGVGSHIAYDNVKVDNTVVVAPGEILDADLEDADGVNWETNFDENQNFTFEFPASGGNPDGHAIIDATATTGGWAILVTNDGTGIPLSGLGLVAGETYRFSQDMKIFSDDPTDENIGGLKVDFFNGAIGNGSTFDIFPPKIGDGLTWETYEFEITIPANTTEIKVVPLWGAGSRVGYDNLSIDPTPINAPDITEIPNADFEEGAANWFDFTSVTDGVANTTFSFSATDGNPDGHVVITNDGNGFGGLVSNNGANIPLAGLGLTAGKSYIFRQDMKLVNGTDIGSFKVEFSGITPLDPVEILVPLIGNGSTWETYSYQISIPDAATSLKVVPLAGIGSSVAYDNITYLPTPILTPPVKNFDFEAGGANWSAFSEFPSTAFDYLPTGGNPGGYARIDNTAGWAVLVSNNADIIPVEDFGITEE
ncbi:hypothetical protein N9Z95_00005, partial [Akkermansiaceae bacterium]|nr:hypothetical protein [Akkermansiaceae bacterium]